MRALLVVCTDAAGPARESEYHRWYTDEHLPDVLAVPGYVRATRYRAMDGERTVAQQFLALYELEVADLDALRAVSDEHMRRIAAGEMRRSGDVIDADSMRALYYVATGPRVGPGDAVPEGVMLVFSDPAAPEAEAEFNSWYQDTHLPEVLDVPGFAAASRWVATDINMLQRPWVAEPLRYLAVYELSDATPDGYAAAMTELRRRVRDGDRMVISPALGQARVQAFTRISQRVARGGEQVL